MYYGVNKIGGKNMNRSNRVPLIFILYSWPKGKKLFVVVYLERNKIEGKQGNMRDAVGDKNIKKPKDIYISQMNSENIVRF